MIEEIFRVRQHVSVSLEQANLYHLLSKKMHFLLTLLLLQRILLAQGYTLTSLGSFGHLGKRPTDQCAAADDDVEEIMRATDISGDDIQEATNLLTEWDKLYNERKSAAMSRLSELRPHLAEAVKSLNAAATIERQRQADLGRCMLGICASSTAEGLATLKAWVTSLELPRGLLHGMDVDGVPIEITGGVYIKYNSGGVYTFADVRKSQLGFDALWKPGRLSSMDNHHSSVCDRRCNAGRIRWRLPRCLFSSGALGWCVSTILGSIGYIHIFLA